MITYLKEKNIKYMQCILFSQIYKQVLSAQNSSLNFKPTSH
jgi:hypothetical protein